MNSLYILIKERFNIAAYLPTIAMLVLSNSLYLATVYQDEISWGRILTVFFLVLLFFLRMRFFDEIKDYEVDLRINPHRPLARGVMSCEKLKKIIFLVILIELILVSQLGLQPFLIYSFAVFYSLLMYEEFFIGDLLRPHLTTYAVTHTFVIFLLSLASSVAVFDLKIEALGALDYSFYLANWAVFNLFEFARKTFAPTEERPGVDTYSSLFSPQGAWGLSMSQAFVGAGLVFYALKVSSVLFLSLAYFLLGLIYLVKPSVQNAKFFRNISSVYLLLFYVLIVFELGAQYVGK